MTFATPETSPADMAPETRVNAAGRVHYRRRTRKDLWDRRTAAWRERCAWVIRYVDEFGGEQAVTPALRLRIERVAELQVLSAKARADCATGAISVDDMVRADRLASHAESRLRGSITRREAAPPSLEEIRARHSQEASA